MICLLFQGHEISMTHYEPAAAPPSGATANEPVWDEALAGLLQELSRVQDDLLDVLGRKQHLMATGDIAGIQALQPREQNLCDDLQQCHQRRAALLAAAKNNGLPAGTLGALANALSSDQTGGIRKEVSRASARMRLLQHQSLANWVLAQKALLHVSRLLEIIATGGRLQPTYGKDELPNSTAGILVDQEA